MTGKDDAAQNGTDAVAPAENTQPEPLPCRRDLVRNGLKLAFVAPILTTFFANTAYGGLSAHISTCLKNGSPCTQNSWCCSGNCDTVVTNTCVP